MMMAERCACGVAWTICEHSLFPPQGMRSTKSSLAARSREEHEIGAPTNELPLRHYRSCEDHRNDSKLVYILSNTTAGLAPQLAWVASRS
jgi:hypothetical protein